MKNQGYSNPKAQASVRLQKAHKASAMGKYPNRNWRENEQRLGRGPL